MLANRRIKGAPAPGFRMLDHQGASTTIALTKIPSTSSHRVPHKRPARKP
tara:strand:- start:683 stop:832 length:150 start_codon:yes stop_codon:yes gene_type:complete